MGKKSGDVEFFERYVKSQAKRYRNYRIVFYNYLKKVHNELGLLMKMMMQGEIKAVDTGTMRKRTDFKVLEWNSIIFGVFEPNSLYYNQALHSPTKKISKYTGKVVPPNAVYAKYPYKRDRYIEHVIFRTYQAELNTRIQEFDRKYFHKVR